MQVDFGNLLKAATVGIRDKVWVRIIKFFNKTAVQDCDIYQEERHAIDDLKQILRYKIYFLKTFHWF